MKIQQAVTAEELQELLTKTPDDGPLVSMILPMEVRGPETRQNAIRLKSALKRVRELLAEESEEPEAVDALLAPVEDLVEDDGFWQNQEKTLALYVAPGFFESFMLASSFAESVSIGPRFQVIPLLHAISQQPSAHVLSLGQNAVGLYHYDRGRLNAVEVKDLPTDLESALLIDPEQSMQQHAVTNSQAHAGPVMSTYGQGGHKDERLGHLKDFLRKVESAVTKHLEGERAPLYLATVEENEALYRQMNRYAHLSEKSLRGSFEHLPKEELSRKLAPILEAESDDFSQSVCESVSDAVLSGAGTTNIDEAIIAAADGRVGSCVIALDAPARTGSWDPETREVRHDKEASPRHASLAETLAAESWCHGGTLHFAPRAALPENASVAVTYRY